MTVLLRKLHGQIDLCSFICGSQIPSLFPSKILKILFQPLHWFRDNTQGLQNYSEEERPQGGTIFTPELVWSSLNIFRLPETSLFHGWMDALVLPTSLLMVSSRASFGWWRFRGGTANFRLMATVILVPLAPLLTLCRFCPHFWVNVPLTLETTPRKKGLSALKCLLLTIPCVLFVCKMSEGEV